MGKHIVITGAGIISAIGNDKASVLQSLKEGKTGIGAMRFLRSSHHELPVGEVKLSDEQMKAMLAIDTSCDMSRTTLMGILAVRQALDEARLVKDEGRRVVLVSGTTVGGMDKTEHYFHTFADSDQHIDCLRTHDGGSCTKAVASHFDLFDRCTTVSTACSSAANALVVGANLIKAGKADVVVAGGCEALTRFHLNGFRSLMILDHEPCRPFDATRQGLNLGEGAAYMVLESEQSARNRHVEPLAFLTGYGNACDAFHLTASSADGEGAFLAMKEALEMAQLTPQDVDYVNAHGTGTPNNDASESAALKRLFGKQLPSISSTKGFTGHATSASGSIETVICLLAMRHGFIPQNLGWQRQADDCIAPSLGMSDCRLNHVLCNSFGFGGNDTSLLFSLRPQDSTPDILSIPASAIRHLARVEITGEDKLAEVRAYVKPMELRRMGKMMKSALLSSMRALEQAGIKTPDAIITATSLGCLENSEKLLFQLQEEGEVMLKQTLFMQSTHNTISSSIAIKTQCHGYNMTYTHGKESLEWALLDAEMLLRSGKAKTVLVGLHDESTPLYRSVQARLGNEDTILSIHSIAFVLTCGD